MFLLLAVRHSLWRVRVIFIISSSKYYFYFCSPIQDRIENFVPWNNVNGASPFPTIPTDPRPTHNRLASFEKREKALRKQPFKTDDLTNFDFTIRSLRYNEFPPVRLINRNLEACKLVFFFFRRIRIDFIIRLIGKNLQRGGISLVLRFFEEGTFWNLNRLNQQLKWDIRTVYFIALLQFTPGVLRIQRSAIPIYNIINIFTQRMKIFRLSPRKMERKVCQTRLDLLRTI